MANKYDKILGAYREADTSTVTTVDTKDNILALTPTSPQTAFASDTSELFIYDGSNWQVASISLSVESVNPDAGFTQLNDKKGYGSNYITDKALYNMVLGNSARTDNYGIRIDTSLQTPLLQIYYNNKWNDLYSFDYTTNNELEYSNNNSTFDTWSGDSNTLGLNDLPITQQYKTCAGAYPAPITHDCGTF